MEALGAILTKKGEGILEGNPALDRKSSQEVKVGVLLEVCLENLGGLYRQELVTGSLAIALTLMGVASCPLVGG